MNYPLADVDMDVLTDTQPPPPPYYHNPCQCIHWSTIHKHISVAPFHHSLSFLPPDSVWKTSVQEKPPSTSWNSSRVSAQTMLYTSSLDTSAREHWKPTRTGNFASAPSIPHTSNPYPFDTTKNRSQDTGEVRWQEPPQHVGALHSTSVATLVDEFERSLTLVIPSSEADPVHHPATPVFIPPDPSVDSPVAPSLGNQSPVYPLRSNDAILSNFNQEFLGQGRDRSKPPLEREKSKPDRERIYNLNLADQPRPPLDTASPSTHIPIEPLANPNSAPHAYPRPPTPPVSHWHRPLKPIRRTTDTTAMGLAELPVAQASARRRKPNQSQPNPGTGGASRPMEVCGNGPGWGMSSSLKTAVLDLVLRNPTSTRCSPGRRRRKVEVVDGKGERYRMERPAHIKQTRFVIPDLEDEEEQSRGASSPDRSRRTRAGDSTRRSGGPGPLRSILRNKPAPYDKGVARHAARVPVP